MCIAIVKTKDGKITDNELRNCFDSNPDGAGIAYSKNGSLYIVKGIFDEKEFIDQYHKAEAEADGAMLIHCRISTSGNVDKVNCHPHVVNDNCVMIHNGILDIDVPKDSKVSDTVIFVNELLKPLPMDFMLDDGIMNMITYIIGKSNKFAFLNSNGDYAIANEKAGHWKDGVWFSNYSYKDYGYSWGKFGKKTKYGYYDGYGWYDDYEDEYEDYYKLTADEKEKLELVITNMTEEQFIKLGAEPVYDFWTGSLKRLSHYDTDGERYLEDLDNNLFELYEDMYYDAIDSAYLNAEGTVGELSEDEHLEEWQQYILKRYSDDGTSDEEDVEFDNEHEGYTVAIEDVLDDIGYYDYLDDEDDDNDDNVIDVDYSTEDIYANSFDDVDTDKDVNTDKSKSAIAILNQLKSITTTK